MAKKKQALDAKRANIFLMDPEDLYLETDPGKAYYDTRVHNGFEEHVVKGMLRHGVKQTISVVKQGDLVIVVDGRQRVINALEAKRRQLEEGVPENQTIRLRVQVERGSEEKLREVQMLANFHRRAEDPISAAHKIQAYLDGGRTEEDAAEFLGVVVKTIKNRLKLLDLCPEVQAAISSGKVKASKALAWTNLSYEEQREKLEAALNPKPRTTPKIRKPTKKKVKAVLESNGNVPEPVKAAIRWLRGEIDDEEACGKIKGFKKALEVS